MDIELAQALEELEQLRKENAELQDKLKNLASVAEVRLANWQKYEKENAELKAKLNAMEADRNECCRLLNLAKLSLYNAKDLINEFMQISKASDEDFEHDYSELVAEAEQFLSEVEK